MKPKLCCALFLLGGAFLIACSGKTVDEGDGDGGGSGSGGGGGDGTALCAPVCQEREAADCNEFGSVDNCRLVCGLLLTGPEPCRSASRALLECRDKRPSPCSGCNAELNRANAACVD